MPRQAARAPSRNGAKVVRSRPRPASVRRPAPDGQNGRPSKRHSPLSNPYKMGTSCAFRCPNLAGRINAPSDGFLPSVDKSSSAPPARKVWAHPPSPCRCRISSANAVDDRRGCSVLGAGYDRSRRRLARHRDERRHGGADERALSAGRLCLGGQSPQGADRTGVDELEPRNCPLMRLFDRPASSPKRTTDSRCRCPWKSVVRSAAAVSPPDSA